VAVCYGALQYVLQYVAVCCSALQNVLQCVLQCVAVERERERLTLAFVSHMKETHKRERDSLWHLCHI